VARSSTFFGILHDGGRHRARRRGFLAAAAACSVLAGLGALAPAAMSHASTPAVATRAAAETTISTSRGPAASPPGSNVYTCRPPARHPYPVVLVHGTFGNAAGSWRTLSPILAGDGYCVFALNYGGSPGGSLQGYGPIETSAAQLAAFVNRVLAATGARKVDIVGHSQGGMMPRYYLAHLGGATRVHTLVGLAPSNHGTTLSGLVGLLKVFPGSSSIVTSLCAACTEQIAGSRFLTALNAGGDTVRGVHYTVIESRYDEVVTPYTSAFLTGPHVTNITLQRQCPLDFSDHLSIIKDAVALRDVENALDPAHPKPPVCVPVAPVIGG
jgi:triacylglycerol esterase/lipase EstA (alpha/beta hydrolase family)